MTANEIIEGVSIAIDSAVPNVPIAMDDVEQDFPEPGFSIVAIQPSRRQLVGLRYENSVPLDVRYFPAPGTNPKREMHEVAEALYTVFELITTVKGEKVRGGSMHHEIVDDVLHFFVTFSGHLLREADPVPMMQTYNLDTEVENGESN